MCLGRASCSFLCGEDAVGGGGAAGLDFGGEGGQFVGGALALRFGGWGGLADQAFGEGVLQCRAERLAAGFEVVLEHDVGRQYRACSRPPARSDLHATSHGDGGVGRLPVVFFSNVATPDSIRCVSAGGNEQRIFSP